MDFFDEGDLHGRNSIPGTRGILTTHKERKIRSSRKNLYHHTRNGAYDPLSYYHVLDTLLDIRPGNPFRTRDLVPFLGMRKRQLVWDPVTVGRIISDIAEALSESLGYKAIGTNRRYDGLWFDISGHPEARAAMERLLEDLMLLSDEELAEETKGNFPKRLGSPLESCPSVSLG